MRAPFTKLYVHLVWATWDRLPLITPVIEPRLYAAIQAKSQELGCQALIIGGVADHVHVLMMLKPTVSISKLVQEIKGATSHLVTHCLTPGEFFKWQGAYAAFSVSKNDIPHLQRYIQNQKNHHSAGNLNMEWEVESENQSNS